MNWIASSILMMAGSVFLYLVVRKSSIQKYPTSFNNLAMFLVPFFIYLNLGLFYNLGFLINTYDLLLIFLSSIFFSYLANFASLKSIELAPNPGYSLVISKSYVVFTTIFSYLFLEGEINISKIIAIALIIFFSGLIVIDPRKNKDVSNKHWFLFTVYAFFGWGFLSLITKYLALRGIPTLITLSYLYLFVSIIIIIEKILRKQKYKIDYLSLKYFLMIGISSAIFNFFNFYSLSIAPNVGYVNAINASSISIVTILSVLFFKDDFSIKKVIGVIGVTAGLLILIIVK